jgi:hypothetical protein
MRIATSKPLNFLIVLSVIVVVVDASRALVTAEGKFVAIWLVVVEVVWVGVLDVVVLEVFELVGFVSDVSVVATTTFLVTVEVVLFDPVVLAVAVLMLLSDPVVATAEAETLSLSSILTLATEFEMT